jgi:hypothetical protein
MEKGSVRSVEGYHDEAGKRFLNAAVVERRLVKLGRDLAMERQTD